MTTIAAARPFHGMHRRLYCGSGFLRRFGADVAGFFCCWVTASCLSSSAKSRFEAPFAMLLRCAVAAD